jgi:hypothetical protein
LRYTCKKFKKNLQKFSTAGLMRMIAVRLLVFHSLVMQSETLIVRAKCKNVPQGLPSFRIVDNKFYRGWLAARSFPNPFFRATASPHNTTNVRV